MGRERRHKWSWRRRDFLTKDSYDTVSFLYYYNRNHRKQVKKLENRLILPL